MSKTKSDLIDEVYQNVLDDRQRLNEAYQSVKQAAGEDPLLKAQAVRTCVLVSEAMIKANAQLLELVKVQSKSGEGGDAGVLSEGETEEMWDQIEGEKLDDKDN